MSDRGGRKSIFKKGKGREFLRFLIGELVIVVLVSVVYLFILQGDIPLPAIVRGTEASVETKTPAVVMTTPIAEATSAPIVEPTTEGTEENGSVEGMPGGTEETETPAPEITTILTPEPTATPTPVPTVMETIAPTDTPTPAPTATPIPLDKLSAPVAEDERPTVPGTASDKLKMGLQDLHAFRDADQNVVVIGGYAYIEGMDANQTTLYLSVYEANTGELVNVYPATRAPEAANLSFDENAGTNLTEAFFTAAIDASGYANGSYLLNVVAVNGDAVQMNYFDDFIYHFRIQGGVLTVVE